MGDLDSNGFAYINSKNKAELISLSTAELLDQLP
jgi:hypothetical protein